MDQNAPFAIRTDRLTKCFPQGERWLGLLPAALQPEPAVDALTLAVRQGELFGLLGPNGAGKTTLVKMLATLVVPTSGSALVSGYDLADDAAIRSVIGLVTTDERSFYWRLTGRQNLSFFGRLHALEGLPDRISETLSLVGLDDAADQPFKAYSTGMRQRLAIARALLHRPQILFLDEPTRGLDPPAIRSLHHLIREDLTTHQGLTVLMTTHWLAEAEALCDRLAVLHRGRLRGLGTVAELRGWVGETASFRVRAWGAPAAAWPPAAVHQADGSVLLPNDPAELNETIDALRRAGATIETVEREEAPLEAVFDRLLETGSAPPIPEGPAPVPFQPPAAARRSPGFMQTAQAFLQRDWQSERSYRLAFLLSFGGIFFSAAVFYFVAQLVDAAAAPFLAEYGGSYFAFVLIGIALQRYFSVGLTGFANAFRQAQTTGTLEAMLTTPTRLWQIVTASALWGYGLVTLQVALYVLVGWLLLGVPLHVNAPAVLLATGLSVTAFAALGILAAAFVMVIKRGDPLSWAVGAVSTFFGGVYFPVEVLPEWLQPLSALLPMTYGLHAIRLALLEGAGIAALSADLLALALFCVLLLPVGLMAFRAAVRRARIDGSLTHY